MVAGLTGDFWIVLVVRAELQESFVQGVPGAQSQLGNQLSNKDTELRFIAGLSHARWVAMFLLKCFFPHSKSDASRKALGSSEKTGGLQAVNSGKQ